MFFISSSLAMSHRVGFSLPQVRLDHPGLSCISFGSPSAIFCHSRVRLSGRTGSSPPTCCARSSRSLSHCRACPSPVAASSRSRSGSCPSWAHPGEAAWVRRQRDTDTKDPLVACGRFFYLVLDAAQAHAVKDLLARSLRMHSSFVADGSRHNLFQIGVW